MKIILDHISNNYEKLTPSQQKIAEHIFHNPNDALILNSTQIANKVKVSEATVTRFITTLGFSGFSEFKREIGKLVFKDYSTTKKLAESAETFEGRKSIFTEILMGDIENIRSLTADIYDEVFEEAVGKLSSARSIYILGLRSSYALAFYLAFNLPRRP